MGSGELVFPGGLTYSGHPLAAATVVASLDTIAAEAILEHARASGENRIHIVPPCVVTGDEVAEAMAIYDEVLTAELE